MDVDSAPHSQWQTSAVEAFSSTFLFREHIARGRNSWNKLPVELLLIIFGLVYSDIFKFLEEDFTSGSLFPYAIASVSALWRDTMSLEPKFWQRVIIFIDDPSFLLSTLEAQFSWSRDLELDVVISERNFDHVDSQHERSQIDMIMKTISSHIHRIRDLRFDVMFGSSLPAFPYSFRGTFPSLKCLKLQCREDDGVSSLESESVAGTEHHVFHCPQLRSVVINGRNYYDACKKDTRCTRWTDSIAGVSQLTISRFKPRFGESLSAHELFSRIPDVVGSEVVCIHDLILVPSPAVLPPLHRHVGWLDFEDCHDPQIMHEIFDIASAPFYLSFKRCNLGGATDGIGSFGHMGRLGLEEINHDLTLALRFWNGPYLDVVDCLSFDDAFLGAMATKENGIFNCAPYVRGLIIRHCQNFSVAALRGFVESKLHLPLTPDGQLISTRVERILVFGDVPPFLPQDIAWFQENVTYFSCSGSPHS